MLEKNFLPPLPEISMRETARRLKLAKEFLPEIQSAITGLIVSGSVSYGANYSVTEKSDIDMQLLITPESVKELLATKLFDADKLNKGVNAYLANIIKQFSLSFDRDGVEMQCHFWDDAAFKKAITFESISTTRLRSQIATPNTDYAYSFDGSENILEIFGTMVDEYPTSDFPTYRIVDNIMYFCRPITNILGMPIILYGEDKLTPHINKTWQMATKFLVESNKGDVINLVRTNLLNTLPGKNKISEEHKLQIEKRTKEELNALDQKYN